jgi:hypothetical protein
VEVFLCTDDVFGQVGGVTLYTTLPITIRGMFSGHWAKTESMMMQLWQHTKNEEHSSILHRMRRSAKINDHDVCKFLYQIFAHISDG